MNNLLKVLLILVVTVVPLGLIVTILYNVVRNYIKHNKQKDTKEDE